jgi:YidC/Oxa1 family membrane protein insertase
MEQKRLLIAIAVSLAILLGFEFLVQPHLPHPPPPPPVAASSTVGTAADSSATPGAPAMGGAGVTAPAGASSTAASPTVAIAAPSLAGSISLRGALLDNLVLTDYHETIDPKSPLVQLLHVRGDPGGCQCREGGCGALSLVAHPARLHAAHLGLLPAL